jgi:hypothetical protein
VTGNGVEHQHHHVMGSRVDEPVDIATLDELLRDNRRVEALRVMMADLREHRLTLRSNDERSDENHVALARIVGILADDWPG